MLPQGAMSFPADWSVKNLVHYKEFSMSEDFAEKPHFLSLFLLFCFLGLIESELHAL